MVFHSFEFLIFFLVVFAFYYLASSSLQKYILLAASFYFYASFGWTFLPFLVGITLAAYCAGLLLERMPDGRGRTALLTAALAAILASLLFMKYFGFLAAIAGDVARAFGQDFSTGKWKLIVPVGLSFYTFQCLGYVVDVYRRSIPAERNYLLFSLYVGLFLHILAGPIARAGHILPQLRRRVSFDYDLAISGLQLMLWGFVKKLVIADKLKLTVDKVFATPTEFVGIPLLVAAYFYAIQIYCDFSGYSDIAIGGARLFGIELMDNFNRPYLARSISEFWRRWHISLYSWFRDYIYIPLGGRMDSRLLTYRNVLIVFLITGLWHGASYTFVLWGLGHGLALIAQRSLSAPWGRLLDLLRLRSERARDIVNGLVTFHTVMLLWILFRANTLADAWHVYTHMYQNLWPISFRPERGDLPLVLCVSLLLLDFLMRGQSPSQLFPAGGRPSPKLRWALCSALFLLVVFLGEYDNHQFIYFVF